MALLSISEPGQSQTNATSTYKRAAGIDLGTTNSLVATAREGVAETLPDSKGRYLLPSVVRYLDNGNTCVGYEARNQSHADPANTIASVKRLMGRGLDDIEYDLPYSLADSEQGGMPRILTVAGPVSPVQVSAEILKVLAARAEQKLGGDLEGVVITVPAYFDEAQRQATKDAAKLAGVNVLRLLSEPTAAAVAYGLDEKLEGTIIIFDLGGGTFDVSLMKLQQGVFEVLATGGDAALGGDDLDRKIVGWIKQQAGIDKPLAASQLSEVLAIARAAKHALSEMDKTEISFAGWTGVLDTDTFNSLVDPLIDLTLKACRRVLRDAGITIDEVTDVVMVGGSTRSPRVQEKVGKFFQQELLSDIDPDQVVAIGAALQADVLAGNKYGKEMLLLDVIPLSLGIETMGGLMEKIIPRNTTIPVARAQEFTTFKDGQTAMALHVLQGERELVADCRSLARFELKGIPPMVAGAARIRVTYQVDADGLMEVNALELTSGVESSIVVKPSFGLAENEIEQMITASFSAAAEDKQARALRESQVEGSRIIEAITAALNENGKELLSEEEFSRLSRGVTELAEIISGDDADLITARSEALNELSADFAARRMDAQINNALSGHTLEELEK